MDRIGFISDIHACEDSLLAVLEDIARQGIDRIFCLGDIVGYGPDPLFCVDKIRGVASVAVLGNHDAMALNRDIPLEEMPHEISLPLLHARERGNLARTGILRAHHTTHAPKVDGIRWGDSDNSAYSKKAYSTVYTQRSLC